MEYIELDLDSNVATASATGGYSSTTWPLFQLSNRVTDIYGIKILEASIPQTWYNFISTNSLLWRGSLPADTFICPVPPSGRYTIQDFLNKWALLLNSGSFFAAITAYIVTLGGTGSVLFTPSITPGLTINVEADIIGNGGTFTVNDKVFELLLPENINFQFLGFRSFSNVSLTTGSPLLSNSVFPYIPNPEVPGYLSVASKKLGPLFKMYSDDTRYSTAYYKGEGQGTPFIGTIPIEPSNNFYFRWKDNNPTFSFNVGNLPTIDSLDICFQLGGTQTVVDLNGANFFIKIGMLIKTDKPVRGPGYMLVAPKWQLPIIDDSKPRPKLRFKRK